MEPCEKATPTVTIKHFTTEKSDHHQLHLVKPTLRCRYYMRPKWKGSLCLALLYVEAATHGDHKSIITTVL
jgi:hypothetical protein